MGTRLYVGNIPYSTTDADLRNLFGQNGRQVTDVKIITDRETGQSRGFAFVEMATAEDAQAVIHELHGSSVGGRAIVVNEARERTPGAGPRGPRPGGFSGGAGSGSAYGASRTGAGGAFGGPGGGYGGGQRREFGGSGGGPRREFGGSGGGRRDFAGGPGGGRDGGRWEKGERRRPRDRDRDRERERLRERDDYDDFE